jgi:FAD synthase
MLKNSVFDGMLYIGNRPAFNKKKQSIEVNIFDFDQNIYGMELKILLKKFIRKNKKFNTIEELKNQLKKDKKEILLELNA